MLNQKTITLLSLAESEAEVILQRNGGPLKRMVSLEGGLEKLIAKRRSQFYQMVSIGSETDCWPWIGCKFKPGPYIMEYGKATIFGYGTTAHRGSFLFSYGCIPSLSCVCHSCDNPACVNPNHLWLGTQRDNMDDCSEKGRVVRNPNKGEDHYAAKLTNAIVLEIRDMRASGMTLNAIGIHFGITYRQVISGGSKEEVEACLNHHWLAYVVSALYRSPFTECKTTVKSVAKCQVSVLLFAILVAP